MKSYLVPGLDDNHKERLWIANVQFHEWSEDTILIDETQLEALLKELGATASESATEFEEMFNLTLHFLPQNTRQPKAPEPKAKKLDPALAAARESYIRICSMRIKGMVEQTTATLNSNRQKFAALQKEFVKLARQDAFGGSQVSETERQRQFQDELDRLRQNDKVTSFRVTKKGHIYVNTKTLYAQNKSTRAKHELGRFLIVISTDGDIHWFNGTRRVDGARLCMNAPHIYDDGTPCADELTETILELIARCEFATAVDLAIQFVETINNEELANHLDKWPRV